jgi:hypothetical protein
LSAPSNSIPAFGPLPKRTSPLCSATQLNQLSFFRTPWVGGTSFRHTLPQCAPKPFASYYIPVTRSFSGDYAFFCATARELLPCFHDVAHSFGRDRGGGVSTSFQRREKQQGTRARALPTISITRRRLSRSCPPLRLPCCTRRIPSGAW